MSFIDDLTSKTRRDQSQDRSAEAIASLMEWRPNTVKPVSPQWVKAKAELRAFSRSRLVLFTGTFFMSDMNVAAWRPQNPDEPAPKFSTELIPDIDSGKKKKVTSLDDFELVPMEGPAGQELSAVQKLTCLELDVEVVRFVRPRENTNGVFSGPAVATSENFTAQSIGGSTVLVHDNSKLDRRPMPGDPVTIAYDEGKAKVYDGLTHDVVINAPWMSKEHMGYLRMVMLESLSMIKEPEKSDEKMLEALRLSLESTAKFFGVEQSRLKLASVTLAVNDVPLAAQQIRSQEVSASAPPTPMRPRM